MKALILLVTLALAGCSWTPGYGRVLFTDPYSGAQTLMASCPDNWSERERASGFKPDCRPITWTADPQDREAWQFQSRQSDGGRAITAGFDLLCFFTFPGCIPTVQAASNPWIAQRVVGTQETCEAER